MRDDLLGIGLYTPSEAQRLLKIPAGKIGRWLKGHGIGNRRYPASVNRLRPSRRARIGARRQLYASW